jgi:hypothetical protein
LIIIYINSHDSWASVDNCSSQKPLPTTGIWTRDLWFCSLGLRPLDQPAVKSCYDVSRIEILLNIHVYTLTGRIESIFFRANTHRGNGKEKSLVCKLCSVGQRLSLTKHSRLGLDQKQKKKCFHWIVSRPKDRVERCTLASHVKWLQISGQFHSYYSYVEYLYIYKKYISKYTPWN